MLPWYDVTMLILFLLVVILFVVALRLFLGAPGADYFTERRNRREIDKVLAQLALHPTQGSDD